MTSPSLPPPTPQALLEHADFLRRLARAMVRDEHDAEDLVQETFTSALSAREGPRGDVRGWLVGIVRNLARGLQRSRTRSRRRERRAARSEREPSAASSAARAELHARLARAVAGLPEPGRTIVLRRYLGGESAMAIAADLAVTAKTVRVHLRASLAHLRSTLDRSADRTVWIAVLAGAARRTAKSAPLLAAVAIAAVVLAAWGLATATSEPTPVRTATRAVEPDPAPPPRPALADPAPTPPPEERVAPAASPADTEPAPAAPDPAAHEPKKTRRTSRPKPVAGIRNEPLPDLPKWGLTAGWGAGRFLASANRQSYVVLTRDGDTARNAVDCELWRRKPDAPAATGLRELAPTAQFVGRVRLHQLPWLVHVLDGEPGFVAFERYNHHGRGRVLMAVDATGALRWTLDLEEIYDQQVRARFPEGDQETAWSWRGRGFWVAELSRRILLLDVRGRWTAIDLDTGSVRPGAPAMALEIVRSAAHPARTRARAIQALARERLPELRSLVRKLAADAGEPLAVRVHAAGAALYDGGPPPDPAVFREALQDRFVGRDARRFLKDAEDRQSLPRTIATLHAGPAEPRRLARARLRDHYAASALPLLKAQALDRKLVARARLRALHAYALIRPDERLAAETPALLLQGFLAVHEDRTLQLWCAERIRAFGEKAAVLLRPFVLDKTREIQARREAAGCLAMVRTKSVLDALLIVAEDGDFIIANYARNGLAQWPAAQRDPLLLRRLHEKTPYAETIAGVFAIQANRQAVEPLLRAFERHVAAGGSPGSFPRALQRCSGQWIRDRENPSAWRRELGLD